MTKHDKEQPQTQAAHHLRQGNHRSPAWLLLLLLVPLLASAGQPLRVAVISDLNGDYGSTRYEATVDGAISRIVALQPDLVISTGDMVAGQRRPHLTRDEVEQMWNAFHMHVSEPLQTAGIPLAVTPGNHDASAYDGFDLERTIFAEQWLPRRPVVRFIDDTAYPFHYAFSFGDILFISLDATTVGRIPGTEMTWLRQLLARHGPDYQRRVVFSHLPLWPFARGREREFIGDPVLQALLEEAGVELYLSGHHHTFYPGVSGGITFVSQACLGAGPRRLIGTEKRSARSFTLLEFPAEDIQVSAYEAPQFQSPVDWSSLPERIQSSAAVLLRADLAQGVNIRPGTTTTRPLGH
ncbi:MAG: metallophosphoesterase [Gammaproteobacteria bacterium]